MCYSTSHHTTFLKQKINTNKNRTDKKNRKLQVVAKDYSVGPKISITRGRQGKGSLSLSRSILLSMTLEDFSLKNKKKT
jgi:hypothetical protein